MSGAAEEKKENSIDIKGEPRCKLQEPWLVRAALFDVMPRELGKAGENKWPDYYGLCVGE